MSADLNQACADANSRTTEWINRSAGQHLRAMRAPIIRTAEEQYAKPLHGYVDLDQRNHDGSSPHADTRDMVDIALDITLAVLAISTVAFVAMSLLGFWSKS